MSKCRYPPNIHESAASDLEESEYCSDEKRLSVPNGSAYLKIPVTSVDTKGRDFPSGRSLLLFLLYHRVRHGRYRFGVGLCRGPALQHLSGYPRRDLQPSF